MASTVGIIVIVIAVFIGIGLLVGAIAGILTTSLLCMLVAQKCCKRNPPTSSSSQEEVHQNVVIEVEVEKCDSESDRPDRSYTIPTEIEHEEQHYEALLPNSLQEEHKALQESFLYQEIKYLSPVKHVEDNIPEIWKMQLLPNSIQIKGKSDELLYVIAKDAKNIWEMIWSNNITAAVIIGDFTESQLELKQWSSVRVRTCDGIKVTYQEGYSRNEYYIRRFTLEKTNYYERDFYVLSLSTWPESRFEIKSKRNRILNVQRSLRKTLLRQKAHNRRSPVLCYNGIDTGVALTFAVFDAIVQKAIEKKEYSVFEYWNQFANIEEINVPTRNNYFLLNLCVADWLAYQDTNIKVRDFPNKVKHLLDKNKNRKTIITEEFEELEIETEDDGERYEVHDERSSFQGECATNNIMKLSNQCPSDFTRASYVYGDDDCKAFITMPYPKYGEMRFFWNLIFREKSSIIVIINGLKINNEDNAVFGLSSGTSLCFEHEDLRIECVNESEEGDIKNISLEIIPTTNNKEPATSMLPVTILKYDGWPNHGVPFTQSPVVDLISKLDALRQSSEHHPITVICGDGIGRSGTLITTIISCERIVQENSVNILQIAKDIRCSGRQYIENQEQLGFCYDVTLEFMKLSEYDDIVE